MERATVAHRPPRTASVKEQGINDACDYAKYYKRDKNTLDPFRNSRVSAVGIIVETSTPWLAFHNSGYG